MRITFLSDNKTEDTRCNAEWGLSMFIETDDHRVLYDTGGSELFSENAAAIGVDLREAECCMISHGHYDHTNGIEIFCEINEDAPIYMHEAAFDSSYAEQNGIIEDENCGIQLTKEFVDDLEASGRLIKTKGIVKVNECMTLVGDIPVQEGYVPTERFLKLKDGKYILDDMRHEQFLAVEEGEKLHIISGCSHKGVVNILSYAQKVFPNKRFGTLVGGLHTYPLKKADRESFSERLAEFGVEKVVPLHCTGMNMIIALKEKFKDDCIICCAGDSIEL